MKQHDGAKVNFFKIDPLGCLTGKKNNFKKASPFAEK